MITLKDLISADIMTVHTINSKEWEAIQVEMDGCYHIYEKIKGNIIHCVITQIYEKNKISDDSYFRISPLYLPISGKKSIKFILDLSSNQNRIRVLLNRRRVMLKLKK
jgi:hypothetical protein